MVTSLASFFAWLVLLRPSSCPALLAASRSVLSSHKGSADPAEIEDCPSVQRTVRLLSPGTCHRRSAGTSRCQGQLPLTACSGKDFEQERFAPAAAAPLHGDTVLAWMLF